MKLNAKAVIAHNWVIQENSSDRMTQKANLYHVSNPLTPVSSIAGSNGVNTS